MYSTATSSRYGLPRTTSYSTSSSSRYSSNLSSLPPVSTRYTPSRYSSYSTSTASLPRHSTISSRYYPTTPTTSSYSDYGTSSWKSSSLVSSSPSLPRKTSVTSSPLLTRRPSYTSLSSTNNYYGARSGSVSSSISSTTSTDNYSYNNRSRSTPAVTSYNGGSEVWVPRSRRLNSTSSSTDQPEIASSSYSSNQSNPSRLAGKVGLHNLGNTCFMNAVLQCLCHTKPLLDYCLRGSYSRDVNERSPNGGKLIKAFTSIINHMWMDNISNVTPTSLKTELERYAPRFLGNDQQDAQELLRFLLQGLHEDINRARPLGSSANVHISNNLIESRRASAFWRLYKNTDDSKIVDLFCGQLKSTLTCCECGNISVTFDPFWDLSLTIPEGSGMTLHRCLQSFSSVEVLDGSEMPVCESCKRKTRCKKQLMIVKCPPILVIHLKRFSSYKLHVLVESPKNLDMAQFVTSYNSDMCAGYTLYGIVDHHGSISSGHYTAKCKNPYYDEEWNEFNDSRVSLVSSSNLVSSSTYLLFYEQTRNSYCSRL